MPLLAGPSEPLVAHNTFLHQEERPFIPPPRFQEAKKLLPEPVLPDHTPYVEMYWRAWEIAWSNLHVPQKESGISSVYIPDVDRPVISMWDSGFVALFGLYARRAVDLLGAFDEFYARQLADGFIGREYDAASGQATCYPYAPNSTGPNFMAWVEWRNYRASGDNERLERVFWPLMALHRWYRANRTWPDGMYWATGVSSSMDNQPRVPSSRFHHQHWTWVDANMQAILDCRVLEQIAALLKQEAFMQELADERAALIRLVNERLWNEEAGFYQDVDANGRFSRVKSIGAYWALLDKGVVPEKRLKKFVRHFRENWGFQLPHQVPSQSADSEGYNADSGNGWRGGVWPPTNYIVARGLNNIGQSKLAHQIAVNHLDNIWQVYQRTDTFWENYAPEKPAQGANARPDFVGPSGVAPITMLLENVIGIHADWPLRRITWNRMLDADQEYGVRNYPFGPEGTLSLLGDRERIVVSTDVSFTLNIKDNGFHIQTAVPAGVSEIDLT